MVESKPALARVHIVIQTDGHENSSTRFTTEHLKQEIFTRKSQGWVFTFMGVDMDAYEEAGKYGLGRGETVSYKGGASGQAFRSAAANTVAYAESGNAGDAQFTDLQKMEAGDDTVASEKQSS